MEQNKNLPPRYAIRLADLGDWHIVTATSFRCRHQADLAADFLAWRRPPDTRWVDLQRKLRCSRCGHRTDNTLPVQAAPRN
jgi:hypothetical protein